MAATVWLTQGDDLIPDPTHWDVIALGS